MVSPKPERELSTDIEILEASAETVDIKRDDFVSSLAERTSNSLRPARYDEIWRYVELGDTMTEDGRRSTDTGKPIAGFFAKLGLVEAGLKCLWFGDKTQK